MYTSKLLNGILANAALSSEQLDINHWRNPERQDKSFTAFLLRELPMNGHCKVLIGVFLINSKCCLVLSSLGFLHYVFLRVLFSCMNS